MKRLFSLIIIINFLMFLFFPLHSVAQFKKLGQTGLKFLDVGVGARAAAMGEAFTVVGDDANALFYNPAGIAKMEEFGVDFIVTRTDWFADISYDAAGLVLNGGIWGNFGVSMISADYPYSMGTRVAENEKGYIETGKIESRAFVGALSYARSLTDKFSIGGTVKYCYQHLGSNLMPITSLGELIDSEIRENIVSGFSYDFGTIFYPGFESFRLGVCVSNFSAQFKYEETGFQLPLTFKLGIAMDILDLRGEHPDRSFVIDLEAIHPRDYSQRVQVGGEFSYKDMITLRLGYKFNYDLEGLNAGLGFSVGGIKIDYAYSDFGVFDLVNRISLGATF